MDLFFFEKNMGYALKGIDKVRQVHTTNKSSKTECRARGTVEYEIFTYTQSHNQLPNPCAESIVNACSSIR